MVEASTPRPRAATLLERSRNLRLSDSFSVQAGTLYHRMGYVAILNFFDSASGNFEKSAIDVKGNSWDFPVMINYRFGHVIRPYVAGGGVLRCRPGAGAWGKEPSARLLQGPPPRSRWIPRSPQSSESASIPAWPSRAVRSLAPGAFP